MSTKIFRLLVLILPISFALGAEFKLEQISRHFPAQGFENQIRFWRNVFTVYGERDVLLHDRKDVRIIYEVVHFKEGVKGNPREARRQQKQLQRKEKHLISLLNELRRGKDPVRLSPEHQKIVARLRSLGYQPSASLYRKLSRAIRQQRGIKEKFREGIVRSGRYIERLEEIFRLRGLPEELALLPHVESSFSYGARSKAGAVGLWQFVRSTGRHYLRINRYVDERLDPLRSTEGAAQLLGENFETLGTWPLAVTAYNHGRNGILRAKKRHGSDIRTISRKYNSRLFGFAGRNFYPEFLAAVEVVKNYEKHFGPLELMPPLRFESLVLRKSFKTSYLTRVQGLSEEVLKEYNPYLTRRVWRRKVLPAGITLRLPVGTAGQVAGILKKARPEAASVKVLADGSVLYRVRWGDTLGGIASRLGTSVRYLQQANHIRNRNRIYPGQTLVIQRGSKKRPLQYRVQSGDTLAAIARRFRTSITALRDSNRIRNPNQIFLGQVLIIP
ncbi:MAG: LysM peptidoglycan-binding domain-containing protein [Acidobacteriota bacterium]